MISQPGYYRDRAIQMGEAHGAWMAELSMARAGNKIEKRAPKEMYRCFRKMRWYVLKSVTYNESFDYDT